MHSTMHTVPSPRLWAYPTHSTGRLEPRYSPPLCPLHFSFEPLPLLPHREAIDRRLKLLILKQE